MKFLTLPLAAVGILCLFPSTSYAQKTMEDLESERMHMDCPPGLRAAAVGLLCPNDARDPLDCWRSRVECVWPSFGNYDVERWNVNQHNGVVPAPKTDKELDYEMLHMECPVGERPEKTVEFCPLTARDPSNCTPVTVKCVKYAYSDAWGGNPISQVSSSDLQKTEQELDSQIAHMTCPVGENPSRMFALCPSGAKDAECWGWESDNQYEPSNVPVWTRVVVRCAKVPTGAEPNPPTSTKSPIEGDELDYAVQHMKCPFRQRPAKVISFCPLGAKDSRDCSPGGVMCVKESISNVWGGKQNSEVSPRPLKTDEELDYEILHTQCPDGQRPAKTSSYCPTGAKDTHDCVPGEVRCVSKSTANNWKDKAKMRPSSVKQRTEEELDYDLRHMQCPTGERPAKVSPICPSRAKNTDDCGPTTVKCVRKAFKTIWLGPKDPEVETPRPLKTEAELNSEVANMKCPYGQSPTRVFVLCPSHGEDSDCLAWNEVRLESANLLPQSRTVVMCVETRVDKAIGSAAPIVSTTSSPKTEAELNSEVARKKCPVGQKPVKVIAICPEGAKDAECWEWTTDWYESDVPIESRTVVICKNSGPARTAPKTRKELDAEVANMVCPVGQKPMKMFAICPLGGRDAECWEWNTDHYESDNPIESRVVVKCVESDSGNAKRSVRNRAH